MIRDGKQFKRLGSYIRDKCKLCGKGLYYYRSLNDECRKQFCSASCSNVYHQSHPRYKDTDIERILEGWLVNKNIVYRKQEAIRLSDRKFCSVDFYLPKTNTCLFADGDYWHSRSGHSNRDDYVTSELKKLKYKVVRLKGSEINKGVRPKFVID